MAEFAVGLVGGDDDEEEEGDVGFGAKGEGKFGEEDEAGSGPSMSAWKIRREKLSICLEGSTLQKLRKSWRPVK